MSDLMERLRGFVAWERPFQMDANCPDICKEAAIEIERLEKQVAQLKHRLEVCRELDEQLLECVGDLIARILAAICAE